MEENFYRQLFLPQERSLFPPHYREELRLAIMRRDSSALSAIRDRVISIEGSNFLNFNYDDGSSPLEIALVTGDIMLIQDLINLGASHISNTLTGLFPIHVAVLFNNKDLVELLLYAFPDSVLCRSTPGNDTPLHFACSLRDTEVASLLLRAGANTLILNGEGQSSRDLAIREHNDALIALFQQDALTPRIEDGYSVYGPFETYQIALDLYSNLFAEPWEIIRCRKRLKRRKIVTYTLRLRQPHLPQLAYMEQYIYEKSTQAPDFYFIRRKL